MVPPGPPGPPGQKVLGPVVLAGQDLETLKVLWSRGPGTKEVQKVPRTKNWKSPGTMETLVHSAFCYETKAYLIIIRLPSQLPSIEAAFKVMYHKYSKH